MRTLCAILSVIVVASAAAAEKPSIIYIMADDLGYGDLGCYGSKLNATPHIDKLATGGLRFTDFHAASWCMPSRLGLMTGSHPQVSSGWVLGRYVFRPSRYRRDGR